MDRFVEQVIRAAGPSMWISKEMLKDVKPELFARKPSFAGAVVDANHPAFVYGHLATYPAKMAELIGRDRAPFAVPASYAELFEAGKECRDDPERRIYPSMEEITGNYFRAYSTLLETLRTLRDDELFVPNPREGRMKEMFPQTAGMVLFMLTSHVMMHMGQVSTWRRCFGLGPVM
jgi:hypothetical protein